MNAEWWTAHNWDGQAFEQIKHLSTNPSIIKFNMNDYPVDLNNPEDLKNLKKQGWYLINADKQREVKNSLYRMRKISFEELDQRDIDIFNKLKKETK
jgi:hypothetical protein